MSTRTLLAFFFSLLAVAVIGCAGGGSSSGGSSSGTTASVGTASTTGTGGTTGVSTASTTGANSANVYLGTWSGTYGAPDAIQPPEANVYGTMRITIARASPTDDHVTISGTATDALHGAGTVSGRISDFDSIHGSFMHMDFPSPGSGETYAYTFSGAPTIAASGHLTGPLGLNNGDFTDPTALDLAPVTP